MNPTTLCSLASISTVVSRKALSTSEPPQRGKQSERHLMSEDLSHWAWSIKQVRGRRRWAHRCRTSQCALLRELSFPTYYGWLGRQPHLQLEAAKTSCSVYYRTRQAVLRLNCSVPALAGQKTIGNYLVDAGRSPGSHVMPDAGNGPKHLSVITGVPEQSTGRRCLLMRSFRQSQRHHEHACLDTSARFLTFTVSSRLSEQAQKVDRYGLERSRGVGV